MKRALAVVALLAVAGCGKKDAANPMTPAWLHRPAFVLHVDYRKQLVEEVAGKTTTERSIPAIDPAHGRLFVGTSDKGFYALRVSDGSILWRFSTAGGVHSEALYDPGRDVVWFGSDDDGLYCLRAKDGALLYRYRTGAPVQRRPLLVQRPSGKSILVFDNSADAVFALDPDTGATLWKHIRTPAQGLEIVGHAGVSFDSDRVYVAFSTGKVIAYDIDSGKERWPEVDLTTTGGTAADEQQAYFDVDTTPLVVGERVVVASIAGGVTALDATGGGVLWKRAEATGVAWLAHWHEDAHLDAQEAEVPERSLVIAGSGTTGLWALEPKTGAVVWRRRGPVGALVSPTPIAGALLVGSTKGGLYLFEPREGNVIDGIETGTGFSAGAASYGHRAFILTNGGALLSLQILPPK